MCSGRSRPFLLSPIFRWLWGSGGCQSTQVGEVLMHIATHMIRRWSSWLKNRKNAAGRLPGTLRLYNREQQSLEWSRKEKKELCRQSYCDNRGWIWVCKHQPCSWLLLSSAGFGEGLPCHPFRDVPSFGMYSPTSCFWILCFYGGFFWTVSTGQWRMQWLLVPPGTPALTRAEAPAALPTNAFAPPLQMSTVKKGTSILALLWK